MPTTTAKLIRQKQSTLIAALTPDELSGVLFEEYDRSEPFEEWADANPRAAMRKFYIEDLATYETPLISDGLIEQVQTSFRVQVAYPKDQRYGLKSRSDAMDLIDIDRIDINRTIGLNGSDDYVSGQNSCVAASMEVDDLENVWILIFDFDVTFSLDVSVPIVITATTYDMITEAGLTLITEASVTIVTEAAA